MIIPVRCFTCGKVLADKWRTFEKNALDKTDAKEGTHSSFECNYGDIMSKMGITKLCCRRHMLGHVDMMTKC